MAALPSRNRLASARREIALNLGLPPGHAGEALARALGFKTQAALLAEAGPLPHGDTSLSVRAFVDRLGELGHEPDPRHAACALAHAADMDTPDDPEGGRALLAGHAYRKRLVDCSFTFWLAPMLLACPPMPDPGVRGFRIDRDAVRFNPDRVAAMTKGELDYVVLAVPLHHAAGLPARIGERPRASWERACHAVVDGAIQRAFERWRIELPPGAILAPPGSVPEEYHDGEAMALMEGREVVLSYGTWRRAKRTWPSNMAALLPPMPLESNREPRPLRPPAGVEPSCLPHLAGLLPDLDGPEALEFVDGLLAMFAGLGDAERATVVSPLFEALMGAYRPEVVIAAVTQCVKINRKPISPTMQGMKRFTEAYHPILI